MSEQTSSIISKVWGMCNPLRDDGLSYGDYLEQLTYLIFLKMSDEYALRLDGNLRNYEIGPFDDVVLDFSRMTNFDPLPMLMAGAIIKRFRYQYHDNTFSISGINGKSYAGTMGFFKYLSESISVGKSPGEATGSSNYIPITPISIRSLQERAFRDGGSIEIGDMIERASARLSRVIDRGNNSFYLLAQTMRGNVYKIAIKVFKRQ